MPTLCRIFGMTPYLFKRIGVTKIVIFFEITTLLAYFFQK